MSVLRFFCDLTRPPVRALPAAVNATHRRALFSLAMITGLGWIAIWVPAHFSAATSGAAGVLSGYPATAHGLGIALAMVVSVPLTEPSLARLLPGGSTSRLIVAAPVLLSAAVFVPGRIVVALLACACLGFILVRIWPHSDGTPTQRIAVVAYCLALGGAVLLLVVEATDFPAPYRLATGMLFRGAPLLLFPAVLASRLRLVSGDSSGVRLNLALALFASGFAVEFVSSIVLRQAWPLTLPGAIRAIAGIWLLAEVLRADRRAQGRQAARTRTTLRPWLLWTFAGTYSGTLLLVAGLGQTGAHYMHFFYVGVLALLWVLPQSLPTGALGRLLWIPVGVVFVAAATRATAQLWPDIYRSHLLYAALLALPSLALLGWLRWREMGAESPSAELIAMEAGEATST